MKRIIDEARFAITGSGLEPVESGIRLQPNTIYYMGASSSPDMILVTDVDDKFVTYKLGGYGRERREQRWIAQDLIMRGVKTWLKGGMAKYDPERAKSLRNLLAGKPGQKVNPKDFEPVKIVAVPSDKHKDEDLWRAAEEYGGVGGYDAEGGMEYHIDGYQRDAREIKKDSRFKVLSVKPRKTSRD